MIQHPELDGPFTVGADLNRWNTTSDFLIANNATLTPYVISPSPYQQVWAGDDPANPQDTVALAFPDSLTAETILLSCGATNIQDT